MAVWFQLVRCITACKVGGHVYGAFMCLVLTWYQLTVDRNVVEFLIERGHLVPKNNFEGHFRVWHAHCTSHTNSHTPARCYHSTKLLVLNL